MCSRQSSICPTSCTALASCYCYNKHKAVQKQEELMNKTLWTRGNVNLTRIQDLEPPQRPTENGRRKKTQQVRYNEFSCWHWIWKIPLWNNWHHLVELKRYFPHPIAQNSETQNCHKCCPCSIHQDLMLFRRPVERLADREEETETNSSFPLNCQFSHSNWGSDTKCSQKEC